MIVDAYVHCSESKFLPFEAWKTEAAAANVDGALLVQHIGETDNRYLAEVSARSPRRFKVVGMVDPEADGAAGFLEGLMDGSTFGVPFVGLRMTRPMIEAGGACLEVLDRFEGTIVFHLPEGIGPHVAFVQKLAAQYPNTILHIPHLGWPIADGREAPNWHEAVRRLSKHERTIFGLSSAHFFSNEPFPHRDVWPYYRHILETAGPEHTVWASGFPALLEAETLAENLGLLLGDAFGLDDSGRAAVLGGTAARVWGVGKDPAASGEAWGKRLIGRIGGRSVIRVYANEDLPDRDSRGGPPRNSDVREILHAFDLGEPMTIRPAGGTSSPKWAVETGGDRFLLRMRPGEFADPAFVRFDHAVLAQLGKAGLPVPKPLARHDGTTWVSCHGKTYEVLPWIDGTPFDENNDEAAAGVGVFLARFHEAVRDIPPGKESWRREDHPDLMKPYLAQLGEQCRTLDDRRGLDRLGAELATVREALGDAFYRALPQCVIHGDVHPGNVRFDGGSVCAVYDFDYVAVEARIRDVADSLVFFASTRGEPLAPSDIRSLTQPFALDANRCRELLRGYQATNRLTENEWRALPWLMRSRWLQMRLRGTRKVPEEERLAFVLNGFFPVADWLAAESADFFEKLRRTA